MITEAPTFNLDWFLVLAPSETCTVVSFSMTPKPGFWEDMTLAQLSGCPEVTSVLFAFLGNWAKIASELPQRSGAQCLSKWKVMVQVRLQAAVARWEGPGPEVPPLTFCHLHPQQKQRQSKLLTQRQSRLLRQRQRPRRLLHLSSSSNSSLDSSYESNEDSEPEDSLEPQEQLPAQHLVPDLDLWMPTRRSTADLGGTVLASSLAPCGSSDAASTAPRVPPSAKATSIPPGTGIPGSTHVHPTSLGLVAEVGPPPPPPKGGSAPWKGPVSPGCGWGL